jgi:rubrerythrin
MVAKGVREMIKIHGKTPPFLLKGEKLLHVVHGVSVGESEDFNLQTNKGDLYLTNMRVIFYGDKGTLAKIMSTSPEEEIFGGFSVFFENITDVSIGGLVDKHLEIKYPKESKWSSFKSDHIAIKGMDTEDMGRLVRLIKNYKEMELKPIPLTVAERAQADEDENIPAYDIIMETGTTTKAAKEKSLAKKIWSALNPPEPGSQPKATSTKATSKVVSKEEVEAGKQKSDASLTGKISKTMKERDEAKKRKKEEEFKKAPTGFIIGEKVEMVCPACGSTVMVEPGMDLCPVCKKKVNWLTGKFKD